MRLPEHTKIFLQYFERQFWTNRAGSSGPNSDLSRTYALREGIGRILRDYNIGSIVDAGCGDTNLFRDIKLEGIAYLGLDCVPAIIEMNKRVFSKQDNMFFEVTDVITHPLPQADLIICRDVVHYLPNSLIKLFLHQVAESKSRYLLITHNIKVNLTQAPFGWEQPVTIVTDTDEGKTMALWEIND